MIGKTKKDVLEATKGSGGIMSTIAQKLGCDWNTARSYVHKWEETQRAFEDEREAILDMAEGVIYRSVKEGNSQDAKWILATLGKKRGFNEKHEVEHSGSLETKLVIDEVLDE